MLREGENETFPLPLPSPPLTLDLDNLWYCYISVVQVFLQHQPVKGLTLIIFFVWVSHFYSVPSWEISKDIKRCFCMTDQKYLADCSSAVPVKALEMNGLRGSFPPQSRLGYKGVVCLSYWCTVPVLLTVLGWGFQSHWRHFCSHQSISEWPLCKVASHNSVIDWYWIKPRQLDSGNGNYLVLPSIHTSFLPSVCPSFLCSVWCH